VKKNAYRTVAVNLVDAQKLAEVFRGKKLVIAADAAKWDFVAALMAEDRSVALTIHWRAPNQTRLFVRLVAALAAIAQVEFAVESTGTYADPLRFLLAEIGVPIFRVSAKHSHDAAEVFDGVPSSHDAKSAAIIGWLHLQGRSQRWTSKGEADRDLAAATDRMAFFDAQFHHCCNLLEAKLARHFPELTEALGLGSATMLALLKSYPAPFDISQNAAQADALMQQVGKQLLTAGKRVTVLQAANASTGLPMTAGEKAQIQELAAEADRQRAAASQARKRVKKLAQEREEIRRMGEVVGCVTAAVLFAETGDPENYESAKAYVKALGLNLKERSSGSHKGRLKITKRGSGRARQYLYLAVLRLIQGDPFFKAWYERKVARDGGKTKRKGIVALMRKLAAGLWAAAKAGRFDSSKLFDSRRLSSKTA